jgi:hypothetical protein
MPDDRHIDARQLYQRDYYAWATRQAKVLRQLARSGEDSPLDLENLAEEVADLGISQRNALHSYIQNAIEHLLKLEYSSARDPRAGWSVDLVKARLGAAKVMTPTLQRRLPAELPEIYRDARTVAVTSFAAYGENTSLPLDCPYVLDQVLDVDWEPANRHGIVDPRRT